FEMKLPRVQIAKRFLGHAALPGEVFAWLDGPSRGCLSANGRCTMCGWIQILPIGPHLLEGV
ncbi:MAG: hypothetical protein ACK43N_11330, partial [Pirellulaceae bacterium]